MITIGAGSGGIRAARLAGGYGARSAILEKDRVGGTCVLRGCIPKKLLIYGAHYADYISDARNFGWTIDAHHNWETLINNKNKELKACVEILENSNKLVEFSKKAVILEKDDEFKLINDWRDNKTPKSLQKILKNCPNLENLSLPFCNNLTLNCFQELNNEALGRLRKLSVSADHIIMIALQQALARNESSRPSRR